MPSDFRTLLWLLKLGVPVNLYFMGRLLSLEAPDPQVVVPGLILLSVSAFRCLFPNRYLDNIVFHDTPLSSIFLTRFLATFSEVAYIYQFSYVIRTVNSDPVLWVNALSWVMVLQVVISQGFVWSAILTRRLHLYVYEELGWLIIFSANTAASTYLYAFGDIANHSLSLLQLNLLFGATYLPWQVFHLRALNIEARTGRSMGARDSVDWRQGLDDSIRRRNRKTDSTAWGGLIGLTWMVAYWASLIPAWVHHVAVTISTRP
ncbi:hypothetical protein MK489_14015 [Myxococcota bacterium]|nr:hypothetical protein [Myxococcota bacterium]